MTATASYAAPRIGDVTLESPLLQAALSGYSDAAMRVMARRFGAAYTVCEVMLDQFVVAHKQRKRTQHIMHVADEEHPVGGQLMGADPELFGPAAKKLVAAGFDVIDINFGCPVKKVVNRCRGGFHLSQPDTALEIVHRVRDAVPPEIPVTVKMRRGIDDSAESRDDFFRILDGAFATGIAAITVHGRTVTQRYNGPSRWEFLREVKQHAGERMIFGSGDLFSAEDCVRMLEETGVDGLSVARGAIGNPWIFEQTLGLLRGDPLPLPPSVHEQRAVLAEHLSLLQEFLGPDHSVPSFRKFAIKYARLHPQNEELRPQFATCRSYEQLDDVLERYYAADAPGQYPLVDEAQKSASS